MKLFIACPSSRRSKTRATYPNWPRWPSSKSGWRNETVHPKVVRQLAARPVVCLHWSALPSTTSRVSDAVPLVEDAIDSLVDRFVSAPYLHRVEHSFHAELIFELRRHGKLRACVEIGTSGLTQLIHKEWPETVVRSGRGKTVERRGLFDIVVLAPVQFEKVTLEQFLQGRIEPPIVIEVGLDYGLKHLEGDICKLLTSNVQHPYLIHLSRIGPRDKEVEDRINGIAACASRLRVAYVHHGTGSVAVKRLNDTAVPPPLASPDSRC